MSGLGVWPVTNSDNHELMKQATELYTAPADEEVHRLGVYLGANAGDVEIGVYDVSSGVSGASKLGSATLTGSQSHSFNEIDVGPWSLTEGNDYAVAIRYISASVSMYRKFYTNGVSRSNLAASALAASWTDNSTFSSLLCFYARTRAGTGTSPIISAINVDEVISDGSSIEIEGENFDASGNSLSLIQGSVEESLTLDDESAIALGVDTIDVFGTGLKFGTVTVSVTSSGGTGTLDASLAPTSDRQYTEIDSAVQDSDTERSVLDGAASVSNGDQIEAPLSVDGSDLTLNADGTFKLSPAVTTGTQFDIHIFRSTTGWEERTIEIDAKRPLLTAAEIVDARTLRTVYDEPMELGPGHTNDSVNLSSPAGRVDLSLLSGSGTTTLLWRTGRTVFDFEAFRLSLDQPGDGLRDVNGNELASFYDVIVTNNSIPAVEIPNLAEFTAIPLKTPGGKDPGASKGFHLLAGSAEADKDKDSLDAVTDDQLSYFACRWVRRYWSELEGAGDGNEESGPFDLSKLHRDLHYHAERGIGYGPMLMYRSFQDDWTGGGGDLDVVPSDLAAGGYQIDNAGGGYTAPMYSTRVRVRFEKLCKQVIDELGYHPNFIGIRTPETSGQADCAAETAARANHITELRALYGNVANYRANLVVASGVNYLAEDSGSLAVQDVADDWQALYDGLPSNVWVWTPDILTSPATVFTGLNHRVFPVVYAGYSGSQGTASCPAIQDDRFVGSDYQYDSHRYDENGGNDMHELHIYARDTLGCQYTTYTETNYAGGGGDYFTFNRVVSPKTVGDDIGVVMKGWDADYDPDYASP